MNFMKRLFKEKTKPESASEALPELRPVQKLCYPGYVDCEFDTLNDAVIYFKEHGSTLEYRIPEIIMNNICYRDYLRNYGIETLIMRLVADVPELKEDHKLLQSLREWYEEEGKTLSGYDIQCYNIKDTITVLGHEFYGLDDVIAHRCAYGRLRYSYPSINDCTPKKSVADIHVSEFYESYPVFDSFDIGDDRTYQNYVFTSEPIGDEKLKQIFEINHNCNYCMVHEQIPESLLPILYYSGEGDYMLLAIKKK